MTDHWMICLFFDQTCATCDTVEVCTKTVSNLYLILLRGTMERIKRNFRRHPNHDQLRSQWLFDPRESSAICSTGKDCATAIPSCTFVLRSSAYSTRFDRHNHLVKPVACFIEVRPLSNALGTAPSALTLPYIP
uniref:Uncharacterized protein n=1 Tax=Hyaloperonospora arabidopsidis (strain Emoy2) TaxID=559515 RepID=M4BXU1_HYAAE